MLLFRKLVDEIQMSTTLKTTSYHSSRKFSILLPLRAIQNLSFHYETPCIRKTNILLAFCEGSQASKCKLPFTILDVIMLGHLNTYSHFWKCKKWGKFLTNNVFTFKCFQDKQLGYAKCLVEKRNGDNDYTLYWCRLQKTQPPCFTFQAPIAQWEKWFS